MNKAYPTTIIGIGSPHGDDQFGWAVIDRVAALELNTLSLHKVKTPFDILELLDESDRVVLIDAAIGLPVHQDLLNLKYVDLQDRNYIAAICHSGTHDIGLGQVLRLAQALGKRTDHVSLWLAAGNCFEPFKGMTDRLNQFVEACANAVAEESCDARSVAR